MSAVKLGLTIAAFAAVAALPNIAMAQAKTCKNDYHKIVFELPITDPMFFKLANGQTGIENKAFTAEAKKRWEASAKTALGAEWSDWSNKGATMEVCDMKAGSKTHMRCEYGAKACKK